jgi:hypothetical protein
MPDPANGPVRYVKSGMKMLLAAGTLVTATGAATTTAKPSARYRRSMGYFLLLFSRPPEAGAVMSLQSRQRAEGSFPVSAQCTPIS